MADDRQIPTDAMEALQAAASALFRRFAEMPGASQAQPTASEAVPLGFGSRLPSMAGSSAAAAGTFLEAARAAAAASAASTASQPASTSTWHQETAASTSQAATEQQQAPPASKGTLPLGRKCMSNSFLFAETINGGSSVLKCPWQRVALAISDCAPG